ncbi:MAG: glycosyltransferase family 2 protein [Prochlorococcus marinus CUG1436]|nr:glycosyltransferase family 2 protein [Prochlorococcus marinus CUG1436]
MNFITFIIPAYNEEGAIGKTIDQIRNIMPEAKIVVCDNNSIDNTINEALNKNVEVLCESRKGKGHAVSKLFRSIDSEIYIMVDGDNTYDLNQLNEALNIFKNKKLDMMIGNRFNSNKSYMRKGHNLGNFLFTKLFKKIFGIKTNDVFSGLRIFSRPFVKSFPNLSGEFEIETEFSIFASKMNLSVEEFPTFVRKRIGTHSKLNSFKDGFKILIFAARIIHREYPYRIYIPLTLICFLTSIINIFSIYKEFLEINIVPRIPTLVISSSIFLAGLFFMSIGIILNSIDNLRYEQRKIAYQLARNIKNE